MLCFLAGCASTGEVADQATANADDGGVLKGDAPTGQDAAASPDAAIAAPRTSAATVPLHLQHGAAPAAALDPANALAYLPLGLRVGATIDVIVHVHGFYNCVENVLADTDGVCSAGGAVRSAHHLASQLETSQRNAILLLPEVLPAARDAVSADVGALRDPDGLHLFIEEALDALQTELGSRPMLGRLIVQIHSGGYAAAAAFATQGGVSISELYLIDGLYDFADQFEAWIMSDLGSFDGSSPARRYANVYTTLGGTLANSQAQATRVNSYAVAGTIVDDRSTSTWGDADYRHGLLFKHSGLDHDGVLRYYAAQLWTTSGLLAK